MPARPFPFLRLCGASLARVIRHAYLLGASWYFLKPSSQPALENLVERIHGYWKDGLVPQVDVDGFAVETSSRGKVGERFSKPKRHTKAPS
jgi:hypothetical protein